MAEESVWGVSDCGEGPTGKGEGCGVVIGSLE